jgi:hypothetical protein
MSTAQRKGAPGKADRLFSLIVRSGGRCANCDYRCPCAERPRKHTTDCRLQCAHVITRARARTRTDLANAYPLCASCHRHFTLQPVEWGRWVLAQMGDDAYEALYARSIGTEGQRMDWNTEAARLEAIAREVGVL